MAKESCVATNKLDLRDLIDAANEGRAAIERMAHDWLAMEAAPDMLQAYIDQEMSALEQRPEAAPEPVEDTMDIDELIVAASVEDLSKTLEQVEKLNCFVSAFGNPDLENLAANSCSR